MKQYYEIPKQVFCQDPNHKIKVFVGIAYRDKIICACCGGIFEIEELIQNEQEDDLFFMSMIIGLI